MAWCAIQGQNSTSVAWAPGQRVARDQRIRYRHIASDSLASSRRGGRRKSIRKITKKRSVFLWSTLFKRTLQQSRKEKKKLNYLENTANGNADSEDTHGGIILTQKKKLPFDLLWIWSMGLLKEREEQQQKRTIYMDWWCLKKNLCRRKIMSLIWVISKEILFICVRSSLYCHIGDWFNLSEIKEVINCSTIMQKILIQVLWELFKYMVHIYSHEEPFWGYIWGKLMGWNKTHQLRQHYCTGGRG